MLVNCTCKQHDHHHKAAETTVPATGNFVAMPTAAGDHTSFTSVGRMVLLQRSLASASDSLTSASNCRTVMRYAVLLPGAASSVRRILYAATSAVLACM